MNTQKEKTTEMVAAARAALDGYGVANLHKELVKIDPSLKVNSVYQWRDRGVPGKWAAAVAWLTEHREDKLNPQCPREIALSR
jgi:hypothetical protein